MAEVGGARKRNVENTLLPCDSVKTPWASSNSVVMNWPFGVAEGTTVMEDGLKSPSTAWKSMVARLPPKWRPRCENCCHSAEDRMKEYLEMAT
jgi:hypothetical protein